MGVEFLIGIVSAIVGSAVTLLVARWQLPKIRAEARKAHAEAALIEWGALRKEVQRLSAQVKAQGEKISELEAQAKERGEREAELEGENRQLRTKIAQLENRIRAMESVLRQVFKVDPNTAQFDELVRQIDEQAKRRGRGK